MRSNKAWGTMHLTVTVLLSGSCFVVMLMLLFSDWPLTRSHAALLTSSCLMAATVFCWRGLVHLRTHEDHYLLAWVRKMGGRTTANGLANSARCRMARVSHFLDAKVRLGQAVILTENETIHYLFDGFLNQTSKELPSRA